MSKLKPILFNTEMVKAILDGRKTTTRRVIKPQPQPFGKALAWEAGIYSQNGLITRAAPYHKGDVMWVRETWGIEQVYGESGTYGFDCVYKADNKIIPCITNDFERNCEWGKFFDKNGWEPSIFMPFEAARIFLKVTNVSVERLQDITEGQARAEGCYHGPFFEGGNDDEIKARPNFIDLWESTIKKLDVDKYGWDANPYVWVIEFEKIDKEDIPE